MKKSELKQIIKEVNDKLNENKKLVPSYFKGAKIKLVFFNSSKNSWEISTDKGTFLIDKHLNFITEEE